MAYLPRTDWREQGIDPRNVVPHRLELCRARALGALICKTCDVRRNAAGEIIAAPPRIGQAVMVAP